MPVELHHHKDGPIPSPKDPAATASAPPRAQTKERLCVPVPLQGDPESKQDLDIGLVEIFTLSFQPQGHWRSALCNSK